jgi:hypothetical protein
MQIVDRRRATDPHPSARACRHGCTPRVELLLGAALAAAVIAGCGGSSSSGSRGSSGATAPITSTRTANSSTNSPTISKGAPVPGTQPSLLAFAKCMRAHGVPNYPDPHAISPTQGTQRVSSGSSDGVNPQSPAYQAAANDCRSLAVARPVTQALASQVMAAQLRFAVCMRANGVPNFPDPTSNGEIGNNGAISGVNPNSPAFQNAEKNCGRFRPTPPSLPGGAPPLPQQVDDELLRRQHGRRPNARAAAVAQRHGVAQSPLTER